MDMLADNDGMIRQKARESLVAIGAPAVSFLIQALQTSRSDQVRWEAAKSLGEIDDIRSIPTLVKALEDSNSDAAWLAADALRKFRKAAWAPLLQALIERGSDSVLLRQGAHHVFLNQKEDGCDDLLATLMKAVKLDGIPESVPEAAYELLERMSSQ